MNVAVGVIVYVPPAVGFVPNGPYTVPSVVVPEYEYATEEMESDPRRPDWVYESIHDPP